MTSCIAFANPAAQGAVWFNMLDWHVSVYARNEGERLEVCLRSVNAALAGSDALVSLILNGSTDDGEGVARLLSRQMRLEIWRIDYSDKSNAINQFYHAIRRPARAYGEVDGNVVIAPVAFAVMGARLARDATALTVSGVAVNGRTMPKWSEALERGGRLMGNLHALRPSLVERMVARGIRLPVGLYRGDGLLGTLAAHDLDTLGQPWVDARVVGEREAHVEINQLSPFRPSHLRRLLRRRVAQMRGVMEKAAYAEILYRDGVEGLPIFADDMIAGYLAVHGRPRVKALDYPFLRLAIAQSSAAVRPGAAALAARRVME